MSEYEVTFIVEPMSEETEDAVLLAFDCITGQTHGGQDFITLTAVGADAVEAIKAAAFRLHFDHGVDVRRAEYDLASRAQLAYRLDKTQQAVGLWIRGERHADHPFPEPFNDVAGGVWLWGDVVKWVREATGEDPGAGLGFPTREQIDAANETIRRDYAPPPAGQRRFVVKSSDHGVAGHMVEFIDISADAKSFSVSIEAPEQQHRPSPVGPSQRKQRV